MTSSIIGRLVWKELRLLRGFWFTMLLGALLAQAAVFFWRDGPKNDAWLFLIAAGLTAFYALGCAATAFAGERESGTYELQRVLPVTPQELLAGKLLFAAVSTLLLGVIVWLSASCLYQLRWYATDIAQSQLLVAPIAVLGAVKSIELLAWGTFYSLLTARPLRAAVLAAVTTTAIAYPLSWLLSDIPEGQRTLLYFPSFLGDMTTLLPRAIIIMLVVGCDIVLVRRWFLEPSRITDASARQLHRKQRARNWAMRLGRTPGQQRLLWQQLVRSRWLLLTVALVFLGLSLMAILTYQGVRHTVVELTFLSGMVPVGAMIGSFVFANDQVGLQFRFFAERGVSARRVWWVRQAYWGAILLLGLLIGTAIDARAAYDVYGSTWLKIAAVWCVVLTAYGVGQLCSQWIRSPLVATTMALVLTIPLTMWCVVIWFFGVNAWGAVVPIPLAMLVATWATADGWLKEDVSRRLKLSRTLLLGVPALFVVLFTIGYRWLEIPKVTPQFTVTEPTPAEEAAGRETNDMYYQIYVDLSGSFAPTEERDSREWTQYTDAVLSELTPETFTWLDERAAIIDEAMEVSQRPNAASQAPALGEADCRYGARLSFYLVLTSARRQQEDGNLDAALERYLAALRIGRHIRQMDSWGHFYSGPQGEPRICLYLWQWANSPGQTPERIRSAIDGLNQFWLLPLDPEIGILGRYESSINVLAAVANGTKQEELPIYVRRPDRFHWVYRLMPWEYSRARRFVAVQTERNLELLDEHGEPLIARKSPPEDVQLEVWHDTTPLPLDGPELRPATLPTGRYVTAMKVERSATRLILALHGWRLEHGRLPESLNDLVPSWFDTLPLDPATGKSFGYFPEGDAAWLQIRRHPAYHIGSLSYAATLQVPPHTPYLTTPWGMDYLAIFPIDW